MDKNRDQLFKMCKNGATVEPEDEQPARIARRESSLPFEAGEDGTSNLYKDHTHRACRLVVHVSEEKQAGRVRRELGDPMRQLADVSESSATERLLFPAPSHLYATPNASTSAPRLDQGSRDLDLAPQPQWCALRDTLGVQCIFPPIARCQRYR